MNFETISYSLIFKIFIIFHYISLRHWCQHEKTLCYFSFIFHVFKKERFNLKQLIVFFCYFEKYQKLIGNFFFAQKPYGDFLFQIFFLKRCLTCFFVFFSAHTDPSSFVDNRFFNKVFEEEKSLQSAGDVDSFESNKCFLYFS